MFGEPKVAATNRMVFQSLRGDDGLDVFFFNVWMFFCGTKLGLSTLLLQLGNSSQSHGWVLGDLPMKASRPEWSGQCSSR